MNSQNLSRFSRIHWKKWKIGLKNGYGSLVSDPFGGWTLRFYPVFCQMHWKKKWKFGVKIAYGNFGYYSLTAWMLRIYLFFPTFTDQMENWGECGLWELRVLANCGPNSQNLPSFSRIHWKKKWKIAVKDRIWQPRIYSTWGTNQSQNLPLFSRIHQENMLL